MLMPTQKGNKDKDSDGCMICFQHIGKILYFWTLNLRYRTSIDLKFVFIGHEFSKVSKVFSICEKYRM